MEIYITPGGASIDSVGGSVRFVSEFTKTGGGGGEGTTIDITFIVLIRLVSPCNF